MTPVLTTVLGIAAWSISSYGFGSLLFDRLVPHDPEKTEIERPVISIAVGLMVISFAAFGLGRLSLYTRPALLALMAVGAGAGMLKVAAARGRLKSVWSDWIGVLRGHWWVTVPVGLLLALALVDTALPCREYDTWRYHFSLPETWLRDGVVADTGSTVYDGFHHGAEILYGIGLGLFGEEGANAVAWLALALCPLAVVAISRELDWGVRPGLYGACVLLAGHRLIRQPGEAWVDIFVLLFGLIAAILFARDLRRPGRSGVQAMVVAGMMLGMAAAVKKTGLVLGPCLLIVYALHSGEQYGWRRGLRLATAATVPFLVLADVWLAWSYSLTGNPFYPALNDIFGSRGHGANWGAEAVARGFSRSIPNYLTYPWHLSLDFSLLRHSWEYGIGPGFIAFAPISLLFYRRYVGVRFFVWCGALYLTAFFFLAPHLVRYLMPGVGLMAVIAGLGASKLQGLLRLRTPSRAVVPAMVVLPIVVSFAVELNRLGTDLNTDYVLGRVTQDRYLQLHPDTAEFTAVLRMNRQLHGAGKTLLVGVLPYRLEGERITLRRFAKMELPPEQRTESGVLQELARQGITHVLYRHNPPPSLRRLLQTHATKRETGEWLIYDHDVFRGLDPRLVQQYWRAIMDEDMFASSPRLRRTLEGYAVKKEWLQEPQPKPPVADHLREIMTVETPLPITLYEVIYPQRLQ